MCLQHGVRFDKGHHSFGQQFDVHILGEAGNDRRIVDSRLGIFDGVHIDAHLCVRQRNVAHVGMCHLSIFLLGSTSLHQRSQYLVLNALHTARFGQGLRVQGHAKALVYLDSQFNGHDGGQSYVAQYRCYAKIFRIDNLCNDTVDFFFQYIHRHVAFHLGHSGFLLRFW